MEATQFPAGFIFCRSTVSMVHSELPSLLGGLITVNSLGGRNWDCRNSTISDAWIGSLNVRRLASRKGRKPGRIVSELFFFQKSFIAAPSPIAVISHCQFVRWRSHILA